MFGLEKTIITQGYIAKKFDKMFDEVMDELVSSVIKLETIQSRYNNVNGALLATDEELLRKDLGDAKIAFNYAKKNFEDKTKLNKLTDEDKEKYVELNQKVEDIENKITSVIEAKKVSEKNAANLAEQRFHLNFLKTNYNTLKKSLLK